MSERPKKSIPERSNLSIVIETCLREFHRDKQPGDVLPYADLTRKCGVEVRTKLSILRRVVLRLRREENGPVFECVPKVGMKLLTDDQKVQLVQHHVARGTKQARRGTQVVTLVIQSNVSPEKARDLAIASTRAAFMACGGGARVKGIAMSAPSAIAAMEQAQSAAKKAMRLLA